MLEKLEDKMLYVRILYPNDFTLIEKLKAYESERVTVSVCYDEDEIDRLIEYDIQEYDIGLILSSIEAFKEEKIMQVLYALRKVVYLFGDQPLHQVDEAVILMEDDDRKMESISSTAFDVSESLGIEVCLCDFDPEGEFANRQIIVEHYETLSHIFNMEIKIETKIANPIRELSAMERVLQISDYSKTSKTARTVCTG